MVGYSILRIRKLLFWSNDWLYSKIICICPTILLRWGICCIRAWKVLDLSNYGNVQTFRVLDSRIRHLSSAASKCVSTHGPGFITLSVIIVCISRCT
jgi:hypothetical protein